MVETDVLYEFGREPGFSSSVFGPEHSHMSYNQNLGIFGKIANNYFFINFCTFSALFYILKLIIHFSICLNAPIKSCHTCIF